MLFGEGRSVNKIIAQQAVGFGLLYGSMQLRAAQGPYAEWFEMQKLPLPSPSSGVPGAQFRLQDVAKEDTQMQEHFMVFMLLQC